MAGNDVKLFYLRCFSYFTLLTGSVDKIYELLDEDK